MPDPFSSEYVSAVATIINAAATTSAATTRKEQASGAIVPAVCEPEAQTFGLEPERYGFGKPKRIVIRGKIARD